MTFDNLALWADATFADLDYLAQTFGVDGILADVFDRYEPRPGQVEMAKAVDAAINDQKHLLVEAPTGTGKSLGYGVPAVYHAANHRRMVVIVTANIALQEQLVEKDLPLLAKLLPWKFSFALLKGRGNYLCLKRYFREKGDLFVGIGAADDQTLSSLLAWADETETGDVSELDFLPSNELWWRFSSGAEECVGKECRYRRECFAQKARAEAHAANIIVVNYSLFFAHLNIKEEADKDVLLPAFDVAILDEAHRAAELARNFFGFRITLGSVLRAGRFLKRLEYTDDFNLLKDTAETFFKSLADYRQSEGYGSRIRFRDQIPCQPLCGFLVSIASTYISSATELLDKDLAAEIRKAAERCRALAIMIWKALLLTDPNSVSFIEEDRNGLGILCSKPIEVADRLREVLFDETPSVILTSATLTTKNSFKYVCNEVGVPTPRFLTVNSPFDMKRQALWVLPEMPGPNDSEFTDAVGQKFLDVIELVGGRTLGLFTSYKNLHAVYEYLRFTEFRILKQGDLPRTQLIAEFKKDINSVLLGTESFWAGVDVPGEALSCVIIDRLPFPTPGDPVLDAIKEVDPQCFQNHFLPRAVIAFKQGVGRLIRRTSDRGVVVVLDNRLTKKSYGTDFFRSLPEMLKTRDLADIRHFLDEVQ